MYSAIHFLGTRKFKEAADLLLESLSTFTATEVMEYEEFVAMTIIATGVGCNRKGIKDKVSSMTCRLETERYSCWPSSTGAEQRRD